MKIRLRYLGIAALIFVAEAAIAIYCKKGFIRHWFGDFLVVVLLYCTTQALWPGAVLKRVLFVGIVALSIELLQTTEFLTTIGLQEYRWARLVFGTTFSWSDLLAYFLGLLSVVLVEWRLTGNRIK
ncbi:hypothetical protein BTO09_02315 [Gilvibacter sp. SZ-19]|jgi:hypothetical protein|uniref:ribosomal maturation YjgA family protein n=1 Tax=Gilvibacter sp. SZ-19 TaxID=754429 RepID=UPI000B3C5F45|nr:DUF2809 domain-containing protein [Gilvibacter sp. SZ-19]ARV11242.1 hypothetical protein BTO09_02315 [Gilvibacter sp. SZ-19]